MKKHRFEVDVDNPAYKYTVDPISAHSRIAEVYRFRPPYLKGFFHQAATQLGLSKQDELLDLCCGRGELAAGFSAYVDQIKAVDGSNEMLENAIESEKVTYYLADINVDEMPFTDRVDHIVIGSAVHWINGQKLSDIISKNLDSKGKIFVSHTLFKFDEQPYASVLSDLNDRYGRVAHQVDLWGRDKLSSCGFIRSDGIRLVRNVSLDMAYLYQNQLSYAYGDFYHNITERAEDYKREFYQALSPLSANGRVSATLVNWGRIYSPQITGIESSPA